MPELSVKGHLRPMPFSFYYLVSTFGVKWYRLAFNTTQKQPDIHSTFARSDRVHRRYQSAEQRKVNPESVPDGFLFAHANSKVCIE